MTCQSCKHFVRKMTFLGHRLRCNIYKRNVGALDRCIDWSGKHG